MLALLSVVDAYACSYHQTNATQKGIVDAPCCLAEILQARRTGHKTGRYANAWRKAPSHKNGAQYAGASAKFTKPGKSCTESCNNCRTGAAGVRGPLPGVAGLLQPAYLDRRQAGGCKGVHGVRGHA